MLLCLCPWSSTPKHRCDRDVGCWSTCILSCRCTSRRVPGNASLQKRIVTRSSVKLYRNAITLYYSMLNNIIYSMFCRSRAQPPNCQVCKTGRRRSWCCRPRWWPQWRPRDKVQWRWLSSRSTSISGRSTSASCCSPDDRTHRRADRRSYRLPSGRCSVQWPLLETRTPLFWRRIKKNIISRFTI